MGAFVPPLDFGQSHFRGAPGFLAYAIAALGLSGQGKNPQRWRWLAFAFIGSVPALLHLPAGHGLEDLLRAYASMLPHVGVGLVFLPIVRALDRRFGHYGQAARSPSRPVESKP